MGYYSQLDYERNYLTDEPAEGKATMEAEQKNSRAANTAVSPSAAPPVPALGFSSEKAADSEDAKRQAHEAAEVKRRAEWEAAQQKKRVEEQEQLDRLAAMSDKDIIAAAVHQVNADTDKMTNRSMKDSVSAHIQALCQADPAFARLTMHPRKSMLRCIQYIFRQARDYLEKEREANGIKTAGAYGGDVPDGLCFQWAEDYFRDPDAKEDRSEDDKFVERPYYGGSKTKAKSTTKAKAKTESKAESTAASEAKSDAESAPKSVYKPKGYVEGQISLLGEAG